MSKQVIISIGREFGSGGHEIAQHLADRFSLPLYDYNLLREIAQEKNVSASNLEQYDEVPKKGFSKTVRGFNNSPQLNIAYMQFDFLKKKAAEGESFVVVGRCSEEVLKELIEKQSKKRKAYHNYFCETKWGDSRNYELSINSSKLGEDATTDMLEDYIKRRIQ